jgi:hypothetical protein
VRTLLFARTSEHAHPPVRNVNEIEAERLTAQDAVLAKVVEAMAAGAGRPITS